MLIIQLLLTIICIAGVIRLMYLHKLNCDALLNMRKQRDYMQGLLNILEENVSNLNNEFNSKFPSENEIIIPDEFKPKGNQENET